MWYVTAGHFVVLIHFVHLLQIYCLVLVYGQVVRHILLDPPLKDVDSFWEVLFYVGASISSRSDVVGNVSNVLFWVVYSMYTTIFLNVACHFVFLCFEGDV